MATAKTTLKSASTRPRVNAERRTRQMIESPTWLKQAEARIGDAIGMSPNALSMLKLLVVAPLMALSMRQVSVLPGGAAMVAMLFVCFCALDYLDGVVARSQGKETRFGRVLDRVTDYPLLVLVSYFCLDVIPASLLGLKLGLDAVLLVLFALGMGSTQNRLRTALSDGTLLVLVCFSQGWAPALLSVEVITALLWVNIAFTATIALYNLGLLQRRFVADALSACNLLCGVFSMMFAAQGRVDVSLIFLLVGAACDGLDGAAARRWGGTRWGVYSDDVADGVNYGVAPGVAMFLVIGGWTGALIGACFTLFTISRLVFFTLNKSGSDPEYFNGAPSTMGALVVLSGLMLFASAPAILGLIVGVVCAQMVSYETHYRHLGRALGKRRRALAGAPLALALLIGGAAMWSAFAPTVILLVGLGYGFSPMITRFREVFTRRRTAAAAGQATG